LLKAVERSSHRGADYSATELLKSPRELWLKRRHDDEIVIDAADQIWALFGTAVHAILEKGQQDHELAETYLTAKFGDVTVSGTADLYDGKKLSDWKTVSVWTVIYGSRIREWEQQLNIYAYLLRSAGYQVSELEIVALIKDWSKTKAKFDREYPQKPVVRIEITLWSMEDQEWFINSMVEKMEEEKYVEDDSLPFCSDEYRWKAPEKYAVMKVGRKSAVAVCNTMQEASEKVATIPGGYIETRRSEAKRCMEYCDAAPFCNQWAAENIG
jgi:hypothetical protein